MSRVYHSTGLRTSRRKTQRTRRSHRARERLTLETTPGIPSGETRTWAVLCHATALVGFFVPWAGHIIGPLIIWLAKRGDSAEIDMHGKESLNFQISMLIYNAIAAVLCLVLIGFVILGFCTF